MSCTTKKFAVRTIKNGSIVICGTRYKPREEYNGELDGLRFAFGRYESFSEQGHEPFVCILGTEQLCTMDGTKEEIESVWINQPHHINGEIHWYWWDKV